MVVICIESLEQFEKCLKENGNHVIVVDFTATWCGPCKMISPHYEEFSNRSSFADVIFLKVDVDKCEEVSAQCDITCMPTFQFYRAGKKVGELTGANKDKLFQKITELTSN